MLWRFSPLALGRRKGTFHCSLKAPADWLSLKKPGHFLGILWSPFPLAHAAQTSPHRVFCTCRSNLFPWQWSLRHSVPSLLPVTHRPVPWWSCCSASAPPPQHTLGIHFYLGFPDPLFLIFIFLSRNLFPMCASGLTHLWSPIPLDSSVTLVLVSLWIPTSNLLLWQNNLKWRLRSTVLCDFHSLPLIISQKNKKTKNDSRNSVQREEMGRGVPDRP